MNIPLRVTETNVRALLETTVALMLPQARAREIRLTLIVDPDVPQTITLDGPKIAWAITALVGNALRFVRSGTRIMPGGTIAVRAQYDRESHRILMHVEDDGFGMAPDVLDALRQNASAGDFKSPGLALTLIRDILEAHGGGLRLTSSNESGRSGTTVELTLPCS